MTFDYDNQKEEKTWINSRQLPADIPVNLKVLDVTPNNDDDSSFFMNCFINDGKFKGKTTRIYWWRFKKSGKGPRSDFVSMCKALMPDHYRNDKTIHSYHFKDKSFETTPKEFRDGAMRLFLKIKELDADVRSD